MILPSLRTISHALWKVQRRISSIIQSQQSPGTCFLENSLTQVLREEAIQRYKEAIQNNFKHCTFITSK